MELSDPERHAEWGPYWRSLPPEGAIYGKENWDLSTVDELQDDFLARPCPTQFPPVGLWFRLVQNMLHDGCLARPLSQCVRSLVCHRSCRDRTLWPP